jgi:hypothetical protein
MGGFFIFGGTALADTVVTGRVTSADGQNIEVFDATSGITYTVDSSAAIIIKNGVNAEYYNISDWDNVTIQGIVYNTHILAWVINDRGSTPFSIPVIFASTISQNTTWHDGQIIIINNSDGLTVQAGVKLTIEAGAIVKLANFNDIKVYGDLEVKGSPDKPVFITSFGDDTLGGDCNGDGAMTAPGPGWWGKLKTVGSTAQINIDYAQIKYGGGVYFAPCFAGSPSDPASIGNTITITHSNLLDNEQLFELGSTDLLKINYSNFWNPDFCYQEYDLDGNLTDKWDCGSTIENRGDTVFNLSNNYWGSPLGPTQILTDEDWNNPVLGTYIIGQANYTPFLTSPWTDVPPAPKHNPVIIVPGIIASYLNNSSTGEEIWPNIEKMKGPFDTYMDVLQIKKDQSDINSSINPTDVFRSIADNDFLAGLIQELKNAGYQENTDLFVFPYDWRLNLDYTAGDSPYSWQKTLKQEIEYVEATTSSAKVDIIAHSMGGLLVKDYISKYPNNSIDKFVDIATPQLGSPLAFKILNYGDNLGFVKNKYFINWGLSGGEVKKISQNMPAIYQLLPSRGYFESNLSNADKGYIQNTSVSINGISNIQDVMKGIGISKRFLTYDESLQYLVKEKRNDFLLGLSGDANSVNVNDELHSRIDDLPSKDNYYNIVGCGQGTYAGIETVWNTKLKDLTPVQGDGTVPLSSADPFAFGTNKYYVATSSHAYLPSFNGVRQLVVSILQNKENDFNFSDYKYLSKNISVCPGISGAQVGAHSPVELNIYDEYGNHTGPTDDGDIEENIPGVIYDILGEDKYAWLPAGHNYRIVNTATSSGELGITIQKIDNSQETQFVYYNGIKLSSALTSVSYDISDNQASYQATVDPDGSGQKDQIIAPSSILTGDQINDATAPSSTIIISGQTGNNGYYAFNVNVQISATDNVGGSGVLKTEYSLDNGQTWLDYQGVFSIGQTGTTTIEYYSIDKAGNQEEQQKKIIKIDKTAPVISILLPQENQEIGHNQTLTPTYFASDNFSGVATNTAKIYLDNQIITSSTIDLFRKILGAHKIKISIQDLAGNLASTTVNFSIITDINGTISDVNRAYAEKMISKDQARKDLVNALTDIQTFQTKYGSKIAKEQDLKAKAMTICLKHKSQGWCTARIGTIFDRFEYQLSKVNQLLINLKYQVILVTLDLDLKLKVINTTGYDIIKADVKYLINNL